jgi:hypothetical protein
MFRGIFIEIRRDLKALEIQKKSEFSLKKEIENSIKVGKIFQIHDALCAIGP